MPAALDDMALLRQRVLESLTKRDSAPPMLGETEDTEMEEGEVQESVDRAIAAKSLATKNSQTGHLYQKSTVQPNNIVNSIPGTCLSSTNLSSLIHPGLNGSRLNGINGEKEVSRFDVRPINMPDDLPVELSYPAVQPLGTQKSSVPPWRQPGKHFGGGVSNNKRQFSSESPKNERPLKRLGKNQHPSLVINFGSDDEEDDLHALKQTFGSDPSTNNTNVMQKTQGAEKLRKVEAEIAQAMAVISKAQEMQNAKKQGVVPKVQARGVVPASQLALPTLHLPSTPSSTAETSEQLSANQPLLDIRKKQVIELQHLQAQLSDYDTQIATKRKVLLGLRMAEAETVREKHIVNVQEQGCLETIGIIEEEISRLRDELLDSKKLLLEIQNSRIASEAAVQQSANVQKDLASQISGIEEQRRSIYPMISNLRNTLARTQSTANLSTRADVPQVSDPTGVDKAGIAGNSSSGRIMALPPTPIDRTLIPVRTTPSGIAALHRSPLSTPNMPSGTDVRASKPESVVTAGHAGKVRPPNSSDEGEILEDSTTSFYSVVNTSGPTTSNVLVHGPPVHTPQGLRGPERLPLASDKQIGLLSAGRTVTGPIPASSVPAHIGGQIAGDKQEVAIKSRPIEHTTVPAAKMVRESARDRAVSSDKAQNQVPLRVTVASHVIDPIPTSLDTEMLSEATLPMASEALKTV